jgi:hypothetical protein
VEYRVANALGYHDLTHKGQPISKIFVETTLADSEVSLELRAE